MKHIRWSVLCSLLLVSRLDAAESITAGGTRTSTNATLGLTVVATDIDLPAGRWDVAAVSPGTVIEQGFVVPKAGPRESAAGRRMHEAAAQRQVEFARWRLQNLFGPCHDYAVSHGGTGPSARGPGHAPRRRTASLRRRRQALGAPVGRADRAPPDRSGSGEEAIAWSPR